MGIKITIPQRARYSALTLGDAPHLCYFSGSQVKPERQQNIRSFILYITLNLKLSKDKVGYTIVHTLSPYFQKQLQDMLGNCKYLVLGFDES